MKVDLAEKLSNLKNKLTRQHNEQNDTRPAGLTEEYSYRLTVLELELLEKAINTAIHNCIFGD